MKKRKKIKILKLSIFSLLLLLCFCVPFLVHNNNVNAATNITDLTGITVTVPANWTATAGYGQFAIVYEVTSENQWDTYTHNSTLLSVGYGGDFSGETIPFENRVSFVESGQDNSAFGNSYKLVFNITGGTDVTNTRLITWFNDNNATFSGGNIPEEPTITDLTNTIWNLNDTISSLVDINLVYSINFFVNDGTTDINYNSIKFDYGAIAYGNNGVYTEVYNDTLGWLDTYYKNITITGGTDVTNTNLINKLYDIGAYSGEYTPPPPPTYTLIIENYSSNTNINDFPAFRMYLNNSSSSQAVQTGSYSDVSSVKFEYQSGVDPADSYFYVYELVDEQWSVITSLSSGEISDTITLDSDTTLKVDITTSPIAMIPISGYYRFNNNIASSDVNFVFDYNSESGFFDLKRSTKYIGINFADSSSGYLTLTYVGLESQNNVLVYSTGNWISDNYQYIYWPNQEVPSDVYDYLTKNGRFVSSSDLPSIPDEPEEPDVPGIGDFDEMTTFLLTSLENFLSFQLVPGFSLFSLLELIIAIPLLIYILKLFLGG